MIGYFHHMYVFGMFVGLCIVCVHWLNDATYTTAKVSEQVNRKCPPRNTTVQLKLNMI